VYIAEISPAAIRGRMVSFNQLNIVLGITAAYFSNYLILGMDFGEVAWRWMLGIEAVPAMIYLLALFLVPESPRWLLMKQRENEALTVLERSSGKEQAAVDLAAVQDSLHQEANQEAGRLRDLFAPAMRLVLIVGVTVGVLQQITGINSVFFYAPMIFEQSGIGTDASFMQAVMVGVVNVVFTIAAILLIDKLGRKPLLAIGLTVISVCMMLLAYGFDSATYTIPAEVLAGLPGETATALQVLVGQTFDSDVVFREAVVAVAGTESWSAHSSALVNASISMNPQLILVGILGFVAGFAISLGPVMWVLFSELFPNRVRGIAISFVGLINSSVSFLVQLVFPWELENLGNSTTFLIYGLFAIMGLVFVLKVVPETKGRSLEELEAELVR
jgi:MFS family permease